MRVGIVGDLHEPFSHPMYQSFCLDVFAQWDVEHVHFIGDVVDNHAISFHETDPDGMSGGEEARQARKNVATWVSQVPNATVSIGNHDALHYRNAVKHGIPKCFMRTYQEVWATPNWDWQLTHRFDGWMARHGLLSSGKDAALNQACKRMTSIVQGHTHSYPGVKWHSNDDFRVFGMNVGCGIDIDAYAMDYGKEFATRPTLGCGVVIDGFPYFEIMPCGPKEPYHKSKARKR